MGYKQTNYLEKKDNENTSYSVMRYIEILSEESGIIGYIYAIDDR